MDITDVMAGVITLLSALVTTFLVPWLKRALSDRQLADAISWIRIAARAAEQIYAGPGRGVEKKAYVLALLKRLGVTLDSERLDAIIEAEVLEIGKEVA